MRLSQVVYTPESKIRSPRIVLDAFKSLHDSRELAWRLFVRNISAMYRQSILGYVWAFLPPLATSFTFIFLNGSGIFQMGETSIPYPAYVLIGTTLWQTFVDAINAPLRLTTSARAMLIKINFPREALILAALGEVLFNFFVRLVIIVAAFLYFGLSLPTTAMLVPIGLFAMILLGMTIGLLLVPIGLLYTDIQRGLTMVIGAWLLLTPVVYPPPTSGAAATFAAWNPVAPLIVTTRDWLVTGASDQLTGFLIVTAVAFVLLLFGWLLYRLAMPIVIERLGG